MSHARDQWLSAYLASIYEVRLPGGTRAVIRIDHPLPPALRLWQAGRLPFAFITAHNPYSQACGAVENRRRQTALFRRLRASGYRVLSGVGRAHDRRWRGPSLFVAGIEPGPLDALAREFRQNAVLAGRVDGLVQLHWCRDD